MPEELVIEKCETLNAATDPEEERDMDELIKLLSDMGFTTRRTKLLGDEELEAVQHEYSLMNVPLRMATKMLDLDEEIQKQLAHPSPKNEFIDTMVDAGLVESWTQIDEKDGDLYWAASPTAAQISMHWWNIAHGDCCGEIMHEDGEYRPKEGEA